eukprot:TRINITY_DN5477_c0_g1_i1.p1 TRINITY_DN5477_c0_g1~~TRINITY_DN5477_c0_g1_i1.p1  ORF type:complete len:109 (+),score=16.09 TRINITY_DN5477_c0_g1_i1:34-327(+)
MQPGVMQPGAMYQPDTVHPGMYQPGTVPQPGTVAPSVGTCGVAVGAAVVEGAPIYQMQNQYAQPDGSFVSPPPSYTSGENLDGAMSSLSMGSVEQQR